MPEMGVAGAGLGTSLSTILGTAIYFFMGWRNVREAGFLARRPTVTEAKSLARLSIPSSIQQIFFSAGLLVTFVIIGRIGTTETAAANVLINLTLVMILPAIGLGLGSATLVGQALGSGDSDEAHRWGWDVARLGMFTIGVMSLPMILVPDLVLSPFIPKDETGLIQLSVLEEAR